MKVHFIAIGGSAMHSMAVALHRQGHTVTGSDDEIFDPAKSRLEQYHMIPKRIGWNTKSITCDLDAVILGMHAKEDNIELLKAKELNLKIYSYPEYLYECSKDKTRIVIGGSHGKTTIISMVLHVARFLDIDLDYMIGDQLENLENSVRLTSHNEFIILEGDEYLSSPIDKRPKFHLYRPNIALLSGIAWDHINIFPTFENYKEQFKIFVDSIVQGGAIIYNSRDKNVCDIVNNSENAIKKFSYQTPNFSVIDGITYIETYDGDMPVEIFGEHNLSNLSGAKWICNQIGITDDDFYQAIASFKGVSKG